MRGILKLSWPPTRQYWEIPVLFQDQHLLALDKPSGLATSAATDQPDLPNLIQLLHRGIERGAPWAEEHALSYLANAHNLDAETSGIVVLARDQSTLAALGDIFGSEKPVQHHLVLSQGNPPEDKFEVDKKIGDHPIKPGLFRVDFNRGKKARTRFEVVERFDGFSLLKCTLLTIRPHQVRAHLHWLKQPVVGDTDYGGKPLLLSRLKPSYRHKPDLPEKPLLNRPAVHAIEVTLPHPSTGEAFNVASPWPRDITVAVKYLRRFRQGAQDQVSPQQLPES
jgi:RluA family pseudouridine synthase